MPVFDSRKKKFRIVLLGTIFLFSFVLNQIFPEKVSAQLLDAAGAGGLTMDAAFMAAPGGIPVNDKPLQLQLKMDKTQEKVEKSIGKSIYAAVLSSAVQGVSYMTRKIAYDTARYVAYGGKGQGALIFKDGWGSYMAKVSGDAVGAAVSELGKWAGLDLCHFPNLNLDLYLELNLRQKDIPTTDCTWSDLTSAYGKDAWKRRYENALNTADRFSSQDKLLKEFGKAIRPANTDFGIGVGALMTVDRMKVQKEKSSEFERLEGNGFKDLKDLISGNIKTPADVIAEETKTQLSESHQQALTYGQLTGVYASGAYEIIPQTASMFLNTLGATLIQRLFSQGITSSGGDDSLAYDYGSDPSVANNAENAGNAFNFLFTRTPTQATDYNNIAEFVACPDNPGINNCVMDSGLQEALARSTSENPMTIAEAIKQGGLLNPNWPLISPRRVQDTQNIKGCVSEKYCYSNIQKLRKARILPLGFEIAALRSDPDNPWTLGQVVAGFDDCRRDHPENPEIVTPDPAHPFCHLINPNWVLKAPSARCEIKSFGDALIDPSSATRREECVDVSTCLSRDNTGACAQYGYCTKENNTWHMGADACPEQFNTCATYTNLDTRKVVSYLSKTVDYGECNADNVGCRAYSLTGIGNLNLETTTWKNSSIAATNEVVYFNEKIKNLSSMCSPSNDGCNAFYGAIRLDDGRYLDLDTSTASVDFAINKNAFVPIQKAPEYLGCYDADKNVPGIQWPTTLIEAETAANSAQSCNTFASACLPEEVGCEAFKPTDGGPTIPGKIGDNNYCDQSCVGYETFKQEPAPFEDSKFPLHFIPSQAKECPAVAAGCSQFTNIDAQSRGGEGIEYYTDLKYCEKPNNDPVHPNIKTFYSWEGSADNGYVLRTYQMKPLDAAIAGRIGFEAASPAYILDTNDALDEFIGKCNKVNYEALLANPNDPAGADPDCRALFDNDGHTYYRLLAKTVTVDEACHPLRKTEPVFVKDPDLDSLDACHSKNARWNTSVPGAPFCERCINGGKYEDGKGFCVYQTISKPSESTSCAPEFNGCRAYTGNAVSNIQDVFIPSVDNFEPTAQNPDAFKQAVEAWTLTNNNPAQLSNESIHTGEHSLQVINGAIRQIPSSTMETGVWYDVSFLAKSNEANTALSIQFVIPAGLLPQPAGVFTSLASPLNIGSSWQLYHLGPVQFTGSTDDKVALLIGAVGNHTFFLDQVRLRKIDDYKHYIKDSWKSAPGNNGNAVPLVCDSAPEDTLPGEALGCRQYNDSANNARYNIGFQNLCREKAIACQPVWDTYNTINGSGAEQAQLFNVICSANENTSCTAMFENKELGKCFVAPGQNFCYIPQITLPVEKTFRDLELSNPSLIVGVPGTRLRLSNSSISIPKDTPTSTPLFLALGESFKGKQKFACEESAFGCQRVGQEERYLPNTSSTSFLFNEMYVKNDPELYKDTLCHDTLVGCSHYQNGSKETFFRDPQITGQSLCVYKPQSDGLSSQYGWYLKGVGKCTTSLDPQVVGDQLCRTDNDCPVVGANQQHCVEMESVACSPDNVRVGGFNDIWSNKSQNYRGNVGLCPAEYNTCTEIIDRQDTSNVNPDGKPYYVLFNDKIEEKKKECSQVSLAEGCVLFDKTDEPNKVFDSAATYLKSQKRVDKPNGFVDPVRSGDPSFRVADTNLLMKVNRDRECTEWLACKSYASAISYEGGARHETQICSQLASCDQIGVGGTCAHWVDARKVEGDAALSRLTYEKYVTRPVSWYSSEMSGYSLYNKFQIGDMIYLKFNFPKDLQVAMADEMNQTYIARQLRQNIFDVLGQTDFDCKPSNPQENTDWNMCGFGDNGINGGRCYANRCIYPINGSFPTTINVNTNPPLSASQKAPLLKQLLSFLKPNSCKGVPESDSPYSNKILKVGEGEQKLINPEAPGERTNTAFKLEGFSGANVCQTGACSCAYQKVQYGGSTQQDYWPLFGLKAGVSIPEGICVGGGVKEQRPCSKSANCIDNKGTATVEDDEFGVCALRSNSETRIGLEGYCLEEDRSRPIFYNGQNSFACLTWLPVNISASAVDIYNTDVSAGYNLKDDAEPAGGQVYCSNSTATGLGMYDQKFTGILQPDNTRRAVTVDELTHIYDLYFKADGSPNFFDLQNLPNFVALVCDDFNIRPGGVDNSYLRAICENNTEASHNLARAVTAWLYKQKISNSTLLRLEYGLIGDPGEERHNWVNWGNDVSGIEDEDSVRKIYSLAPLNAGVDSGDKIREFGTIMHPPRTFSSDSIEEDSVYAAQMDIVNPPETVGKGQDARVQAGAYGVYPEAAARGGRVYRSSFERYMRENDLAVVYFLPLSFPGGVESETPSLMEKDYAINFDRLRTPGRNPAEAVLLRDGIAYNGQFPSSKPNRDTVLWTYKLDNLSQSAFAFRDYSHFVQTSKLQDYTEDEIGERNRIQTRYVAVYSDWVAYGDNDETPNFLQQHVPIDQGEIPGILAEEVTPASPSSDPFSAPCVDKQGNWLAIGMDFNKDGEFLGYIARFCQQAGGEDDVGIQFAVAAQVHDRCTSFEQVYKADGVNPLYATTNKARTNLVWYGSKRSDGLGPRVMNYERPWSSIPLDRFQRPYGSLQLTEQDLLNRSKLRNYTFRSKEQGLPFLCSASWLGANNIESTKRCESLMLIPLDRAFVNQMNALSNPRVPDPNAPPPPLPPGWDVGDPLPADQNAFDGTVGKKEIQRLFAQIWSVSTIDSGFYSDIRRDGFTTDLDFYKVADPQSKGIDVSGESAAPPKIYSLNPSRCEDRDKCNAAEAGNITIGNRNGTRVDYNGDGIPDEPDIDQNGVTDPIIIAGGSYSAEAKFFAFADDNHMPIRRMMVDWDEEGLPPMNVDKRGLYKNRKPVCGTSNQGGLADVGICATMIPPTNGNNAPTFRTTGVTCSLDKPCSGNTFCMPASGAPSTFKVCEGINAGGDITYSSRACGEDRDCAGLPDFPTCSGSLPMSDLQSGVLGTEYKTMRFGNTPRACTTDYFTFVHQYSCGESNIGTRNAVYVRDLNTNNNPYKDGSFTAGIVSELKNKYRLRDDDYVCIFKPKVQAMDNWDWCNGTCVNKDGYTRGNPNPQAATRGACYNNQETDIAGRTSYQCDKFDPVSGINPWSDYNGSIIVIPDIDR